MSTLKNFWLKYESKIILIFGFILVSAISFEAGLIKGREIESNPLIIEKPAPAQLTAEATAAISPEVQKLPAENINSENCAFVGSKNSNKYHLPTCRWAKNIKSENKICFKDENEAKARGYLPDSNCVK